jgi:predicted TIM-barrel fold metal-dependent hydrolase
MIQGQESDMTRNANLQSASFQMSRREALCASAVGASLFAVTELGSNALGDDSQKYPYIDAHSHIWTRQIDVYPLKQGTKLSDLDPPSFTTEELLTTAHKANVGRAVLIARHTFYGFDNKYMTDAAEQHPGVFKVVGMIDDSKPHPDVEMKQLLKQHVTGFRITPKLRADAPWLNNAGMKIMWKTAAATGQAMCCLINPDNLPEVDKMCEQFPDTKVVIDHFARIGVDGETREQDLKNLCLLARHQHTSVKISAYYALGKKRAPYDDLRPMIRRLYDTFGPQRLMWASDSPYQLVGEGNTYEASIALIRDRMEFSADDLEWLLCKTAEKVFFSVG